MLQLMQLHPVFPKGAELLDFGERVGARALALNAALFGKLHGDYWITGCEFSGEERTMAI